jgi:hypothetical protein
MLKMKSFKQKVIVTLLSMIIAFEYCNVTPVSMSTVHAMTDTTAVDLSNCTKTEAEDFMEEFICAIMNKDKTFMESHRHQLNNVYDLLYGYVTNNNVGGDGIIDMDVDVSNYSGNSTNDTVYMVNVKIDYDNNSYNKVYLYELHVDEFGVIYAYNVWVY